MPFSNISWRLFTLPVDFLFASRILELATSALSDEDVSFLFPASSLSEESVATFLTVETDFLSAWSEVLDKAEVALAGEITGSLTYSSLITSWSYSEEESATVFGFVASMSEMAEEAELFLTDAFSLSYSDESVTAFLSSFSEKAEDTELFL